MLDKSGLGRLFIPAILGGFCVFGFLADCALGEGGGNGEIKIEGKGIERLVLKNKDGNRETIKRPGEIVSLPAGEYRLYEVKLEGGFSSFVGGYSGDWIAAEPNNPGVLKVGGPLKQKLDVVRHGNVLILKHSLNGIGGNVYRADNNDTRPGFVVYKGDKEIASGKFEYG